MHEPVGGGYVGLRCFVWNLATINCIIKDMSVKPYWYCPCPKCHGQGRLVIKKRNENSKLFFNCDECEFSWDKPENIGDFQKMFLGFSVSSSDASLDEIAAFGWMKYATREYNK